MAHGSFHDVPRDAFGYAWDRSAEPAVEVDSGETVLLHARDASDEQINRDSTAADVPKIDFSHVNPVSGPVFVKGARPGDVLAVEVLELQPGDWGWTALIPGFGLLAEEFTEPWLRISQIDPEAWNDSLLGAGIATAATVPRNDRGCPGRARPASDPAAEPLGREPRHQAPDGRYDAVPAGRRRGRAAVDRRHARRTGGR